MVVFAVLAAAPARAQDRRAEAESLFEEGRALMSQNRAEDACPKLAESHRLEPAIGTLLNLATCYERTGRTASAWARYREAIPLAARSGNANRERYARDHAAALEKKLSKLTIIVPPENAVPGLTIARDGQSQSQPTWGSAIAVDPGEHVVEARADGYVTATIRVTVGKDVDHQTVTVPPLAKDAAIKLNYVEPPPPRVESPRASSSPVFPILGWSFAGTGAASVIVGGVMGAVAISRNDDARALCPTDTTCSTEGLKLTSEAEDFALASTVLFAAGVALVGAGVTMFLLAPRSSTTAVRAPAIVVF